MSGPPNATTQSLSAAVGSTLRRFVVRALDGEVTDRVRLGDPALFVGGEVRLDLDRASLFVSWVEGCGWPDRFSIAVRATSFFRREALLHDWHVDDLEPWSRCIGRRLVRAKVIALAETPHVVELAFEGQTIWFADGSIEIVGDGDDLLLRAGPFPGGAHARCIWSS